MPIQRTTFLGEPALKVIGTLDQQTAREVTAESPKTLIIGSEYGGGDVTQLSGLESIETLAVLSSRPEGIEGLELPQAVRLKYWSALRVGPTIGFFPALTTYASDWRTNCKRLADAPNVRIVYLNRFPGEDLSVLAPVHTLTSVDVAARKVVRVSGLEAEGLKRLQVNNAWNLAGIEEVANYPDLAEFGLEGGRKVTSLEPLRNLKQLEYLFLDNCGDLDSLAPVFGLQSLRKIVLSGDTVVVDGRLREFVTSIPGRELVFSKTPKYDLTPDEAREIAAGEG